MSPSHANKSGLRYCYYQSWVLNQGQKEKAGIVNRVPAPEIERVVKAAVLERRSIVRHDIDSEGKGLSWAKSIERIDVQADHLTITLKAEPTVPEAAQDDEPSTPTTFIVQWTKPAQHRKRELTVPEDTALQHRPIRSEARSRLLKAIAQGRIWQDRLVNDRNADIATIAKDNNLSDKSIRATLSLVLLAPDIVEAAIEGRLHRGLTVTQMTGLPADWHEQRQVLGLT